ncbi:MAG: V-type ATP synthase subunit E [Planctomycetota bacterium]
MSLEDVEKKVLADAEAEAKETLEKAQAEANAELERRSATLRDEQARKIDRAKADADAALERDVTTRRAQHTMKVLQAKNDVLDAIFDGARQRMLESQGVDYGAWLASQVRAAVAQAGGTLHCHPRDQETVEAVAGEAGGHEVTLETDEAIDGGVFLVAESFDLDLTLSSQLADLRTETTVSLAERLFGDLPTLGETE